MVGGTSYFSLDSGRASGETPAAARSFADFAVLYRLSAQSRLLIEAFDRSGIPYQTSGQAPLSSHKAVREVLRIFGCCTIHGHKRMSHRLPARPTPKPFSCRSWRGPDRPAHRSPG